MGEVCEMYLEYLGGVREHADVEKAEDGALLKTALHGIDIAFTLDIVRYYLSTGLAEA